MNAEKQTYSMNSAVSGVLVENLDTLVNLESQLINRILVKNSHDYKI